MASFRAARRVLCTAAEATPTPAPAPAPAGRWERLKNSKAGVWCRSLVSDYKEACKEIVVGARDRPLKASVYMGLLGGAYACFVTKPDQQSFQAALLDRSNQLSLLSPWIRNAGSDLHVQNLVKLRNQGTLRHLSLGLFSLAYSADYDPDSALYEASCSNLSVPWRELPGRVLDVGFVGRWWVLERKMEDFDVNEAEYKHLPTHMQATAPPSVQEVERNERLHRESWLPPPVPEEETGQRTVTQVKTVGIQEETGQANVDTNVDSEVVETAATNVDSQVIGTVDTEGEMISGDIQEATVPDILDSIVDSQVSEIVDTLVDPNVDSQIMETVDTMEQVQSGDIKEETIPDILDTNVDNFVMETDTNVEGQNAETVDTKELVNGGEIEETIVDTLDTKVDSHDVETVDEQNVSSVAEVVDIQVDNIIEETDEPEQHSAAQN